MFGVIAHYYLSGGLQCVWVGVGLGRTACRPPEGCVINERGGGGWGWSVDRLRGTVLVWPTAVCLHVMLRCMLTFFQHSFLSTLFGAKSDVGGWWWVVAACFEESALIGDATVGV